MVHRFVCLSRVIRQEPVAIVVETDGSSLSRSG